MNYYVYIRASVTNYTVYIGVTNDLRRRLREHKSEEISGFTKRYHTHKLVYYEEFHEVKYAIAREKQLKGWKREKKDALVATKNQNMDDWSKYLL